MSAKGVDLADFAVASVNYDFAALLAKARFSQHS